MYDSAGVVLLIAIVLISLGAFYLAFKYFDLRARYNDLNFNQQHAELNSEHETLQRKFDVLSERHAAAQEAEQRYREFIDNAKDIIFTNDLTGKFISGSPAAEIITGYDADEFTNLHFTDLVAPEYQARVAAMLQGKIEQAKRGEIGEPTFYEAEIITKTGRRVMLEASTRLVMREGAPVYVQGIARDITTRKHTETVLRRQTELLKLHQTIGAAANSAATIEAALRQCLETICAYMDFPVGHVLLLSKTSTVPELVSAKLWVIKDAERFAEFKRISENGCFREGIGLPGRVLKTGRALWFSDVLQTLRADNRSSISTSSDLTASDLTSVCRQAPRAAAAERIGLRTGFAFPLLVGAEVAGVVEFYSDKSIAVDEAILEVMMHLGMQLGRVLERERAATRLRESEERYALAARGANDGLWDWDVNANKIYFSLRWKAMIGCEEQEIGSSPQEWFSRVHLEDADLLRIKLTAHLDGHAEHFECEYRMLHRHGGYRWMLARGAVVRDASGAATRLAGSQTDITERKRVEEQLQHDAFHDALTGLPNHPLFMDRLRLSMERSRRAEDYRFSVMCFDFDRFKNINNGLGHQIGDRVMVLVAARIKQLLRAGDTVARLNSDEFAILLDRIEDTSEPVLIAERIERALERPFIIDEHEIFATVSIGIALSSSGYEEPQDMLRDADSAMYRAKAAGRARHEVFDERMHTRAVERLQIETDLRRAVERNELRVYYQPIMNLESGSLHGFEALVRWQHPKRGFLLPAEFIPIAEESGLIVSLGAWVLKEACRQTKLWHDMILMAAVAKTTPNAIEPPLDLLSISVNLATKQLQHPDVVAQVALALNATDIEPRAVKLEITESGMMENSQCVIRTLQELKALGVHLSIDDFGTGYSSLSYLHRFPLNTLKIDRSFISDLSADDENWQIVNTIISLARNLGMETIAEGIELEPQLTRLKTLNCSYGQGYFYARPLSPEAATQFIRARLPRLVESNLTVESENLETASSLSGLVH